MSVVMMERPETTDADRHWQDIYKVLSVCGRADSPKDLVQTLLDNIEDICHFDQAFVYHLDDNHNICDTYTVNVRNHWRDMYLEHYAKDVRDYLNDNPNRFRADDARLSPQLYLHDYNSAASIDFHPNKNDFFFNYLRPCGVTYTCGFGLSDLESNIRAVVSLGRVSEHCFTRSELYKLQTLIPHINNLHKNYFYQRASFDDLEHDIWRDSRLTAREAEITSLLCKGISPTTISKALCIALSTTYKHIANIHKKVNVSSQQELLNHFLHHSS
jgi:DNA-binding CsgD family transcriptional regulator